MYMDLFVCNWQKIPTIDQFLNCIYFVVVVGFNFGAAKLFWNISDSLLFRTSVNVDPSTQHQLHPSISNTGHALCPHIRPPMGSAEHRQCPGSNQRGPVCKSKLRVQLHPDKTAPTFYNWLQNTTKITFKKEDTQKVFFKNLGLKKMAGFGVCLFFSTFIFLYKPWQNMFSWFWWKNENTCSIIYLSTVFVFSTPHLFSQSIP